VVLIKIFKALRLAEVLLMTGFILIGAVFAIPQNQEILWLELISVSIASYLLMLSVYTANSLLGYELDKKNNRLKNLNFISKPIYTISTIIFYGLSLIICIFIKPESVIFHLTIFVLWFLYGMPGFGKHLPVVGTIIHILVAIVQFNFAYIFIAPVSEVSIFISIFFALLISGGHLHHEIIDYEADKSNQIKTSTVKWGVKNTKYFSFAIFVVAHLYWGILLISGYIELFWFLSFLGGFIIHLGMFIYNGKKFEANFKVRLKYRLIYRIVYFICGLIVALQIMFF
jgi:4-hydroxybenzoate polyprenyltransferase